MIQIKKVKIPIYFGTLVIIFTDSIEEAATQYDLKLKEDEHDAFAWEDEKTDEYIVAIKNNKFSVIAHETVHIVNYIFKRRGIILDVNNDEPQAYLTGWIVNEIYKFLKDK
jgi:hypothetical protein